MGEKFIKYQLYRKFLLGMYFYAENKIVKSSSQSQIVRSGWKKKCKCDSNKQKYQSITHD